MKNFSNYFQQLHKIRQLMKLYRKQNTYQYFYLKKIYWAFFKQGLFHDKIKILFSNSESKKLGNIENLYFSYCNYSFKRLSKGSLDIFLSFKHYVEIHQKLKISDSSDNFLFEQFCFRLRLPIVEENLFSSHSVYILQNL